MQDPPIGASEPIFNVPRSVLIAAAIMVALQIVRTLLPDEAGLRFLQALAFIPARYSGAALELPGGYLTAVTSFVTYMLVHAGWVHLLVNLLWMAAFGSAVARRLSDLTFFYFSTLCGIAGALTHLAFHFGEMAPVVGASAAISGQMAASLKIRLRGAAATEGRATRSRQGAAGKPHADIERPAHPDCPRALGRAQRHLRPRRGLDGGHRGRNRLGGAYWGLSVRTVVLRLLRQRQQAGRSATALEVRERPHHGAPAFCLRVRFAGTRTSPDHAPAPLVRSFRLGHLLRDASVRDMMSQAIGTEVPEAGGNEDECRSNSEAEG